MMQRNLDDIQGSDGRMEGLKKIIKTAAVIGGAARIVCVCLFIFVCLLSGKNQPSSKQKGGAAFQRVADFSGKEPRRRRMDEDTKNRANHHSFRRRTAADGNDAVGRKGYGQHVIAVHGYRGNAIRDFAGSARFYHDMGYNLLMIHDRAHGDSEGKWIGFGWKDKEDIRRWCEYLVDRAQGNTQIALLGVSMGGAAVMMASGDDLPSQVKCIIEDCGYSSVWDQLWHAYPRNCRFPKRLTMYLASGMISW